MWDDWDRLMQLGQLWLSLSQCHSDAISSNTTGKCEIWHLSQSCQSICPCHVNDLYTGIESTKHSFPRATYHNLMVIESVRVCRILAQLEQMIGTTGISHIFSPYGTNALRLVIKVLSRVWMARYCSIVVIFATCFVIVIRVHI